MSNETLEEAAEKESEGRYPVLTHRNPNDSPYKGTKETFKHGVRFGAKWQAERMYSYEDMMACWDACLDFHRIAGFGSGINFNDFIKQLKKK